MNLRQLITRARILTCELGDTLKKAATTETTGRGLDMTMLEQRVMLSASPIAPVDADLDAQSVAVESESVAAPTDSSALAAQTDQAEQVQHLVLVDASVGDYQQLIDAIENEADGTDVVLLDADRDGIEQISEILQQYQQLESVHILSHGTSGSIQLGTTTLNRDNLEAYAGQLAQWDSSLSSDADLLIYGCDLAATSEGQELVESLAALTGADVAASEDVTGHEELGGDWILEYTAGVVDTDVVIRSSLQGSWYHTLDITTGLVGHYQFESSPGATIDSTGNQNATAVNSPTLDGDAAVGSTSASFSGDSTNANKYYQIANNVSQDFGSGDFTVAFWVNTTQNSGGTSVRVVGDLDSTTGFIAFMTNGNLSFQVGDGTNSVVLTAAGINDGNWHQISARRSGTSFSLYVDGNLADSQSQSMGSVSTSNTIRIGATSASSNDFEGNIDDLRLFTRSLSTSDIDELVALGPAPTSYGASYGNDNTYEWITNVSVGGINNTSAGDAGGYGDYTGQSTVVYAGGSTDLTVTINPDSNDYVYAYVDWNQDFDFNDPGEEYIVASNVGTAGPFTVALDTPGDALTGATRMRVVLDWNEVPSPTGIYTYGETEDYTLVVAAREVTVTTTNDTVDGDTTDVASLMASKGADSQVSLREAILAINNEPANDWTINLLAQTYGLTRTGTFENAASTGDLDITNNITIQGAGAGSTVISGAGIGDRIFEVRPGGSLSLNDLTLQDVNTTNNGGGGVYSAGNLTANNVVFDNLHVVNADGGAVYIDSGTANLTNVAMINGSATNGGALSVNGGTTSLTNVTISGNTSEFNGSGIEALAGVLNLNHVTIANNSVTNVGGGAGIFSNGATVNMQYSIVANNTATNTEDDIDGAIVSGGYNIIEDPVGVTGTVGTDTTGIDGGIAATLTADGSTYVHAITSSAAAYNAAIGSTETTDQRGETRDANPDIGAYELVVVDPDLVGASTTGGGLSINADGGNDIYLKADDAGAIFGGLTALTIETQFSVDSVSNSETLVSYYSPTSGEEIRVFFDAGGRLNAFFGNTSHDFTGIDYAAALADGDVHSLALTWSNTGDLSVYLDGELIESTTGIAVGQSLVSDGVLTIGQEQDSLEGSFQAAQAFSGRLHDIRIFNDVRTATAIAASYRSDLPYDEAGMIANWKFDQLSSDGVITDAVSGNNLTVKHVNQSGFTTSLPELTFAVDENAVNGTVIGTVKAIDAEREAQIATLLAADPTLYYNAETNKFYRQSGGSPGFGAAVNFATAITTAQSETLNGVNGQLVTIRSASENQYVGQIIADGGGWSSWLGATDQTVEGEWRWLDGSSDGDLFWSGDETGYAPGGAYTSWIANDPANNAADDDAIATTSLMQWNDNNVNSSFNYITEWDADAVLDATQAITYSITSQSVAGAFEIDADTGEVRVADGTLLDADTLATHTVTIRTTDFDSNTYDEAVTISLNNLVEDNNAPTDLSSGIELNTDGGNDAYLTAADGGAILGGLEQITFEMTLQLNNDPGSYTPLVSYAYSGYAWELRAWIDSADQFNLFMGSGTGTATSTQDYSILFDGNAHSLAFSWDNSNGDIAIYVDGELFDTITGYAFAGSISGTAGDGSLVFGQEQDTVAGGFDSTQVFAGTLYDVRIWNEVRSEAEIALNQNKFDSGSLPGGLIANWQMDGFNGSNEVVDVVSGNNLSIGHAAGIGFIASTPTEDLHISENATDGTTVGYVLPSDPDATSDIVSDGVLPRITGPSTTYSAGQNIGDWTVRTGTVDLNGTTFEASPMGGGSIDLNGTSAGGIYQTLATDAGKQYQVIFQLSGNWDSGDAVKDLRVSAGGVSNDFHVTRPDGWAKGTSLLWSPRSFTFTADSISTDLDFVSLDNGNAFGALVADVQVIEIPQAVTTILNNDPTLSYDAATGKFYRLVETRETWNDAQTAAQAAVLNGVGGQLVTIDSAYENELVFQFAAQTGNAIWLGASDQTTEGEWRWYRGGGDAEQFWQGDGTTGNAITGQFTAWNGNNPQASTVDDDYAIMLPSEAAWADRDSLQTQKYVIEWDASEVLSNFTFSLTDDAGGRFAVDGNTGEITVADGSLIDYETATSHNVTVQVTDAAGNSYSEVMSISVDNGLDPVILGLPQDYVTELNQTSPLIHLRLGESSGSTAVDSAGNHDGTYLGGVVLGASGAIDGDADTAVTFANAQHIEVAHSPDLLVDEGTFQLWFKTADITQEGTLFSKDAMTYGDGGHVTAEVMTNGEIQVRLQSDSSQYFVRTDNVTQTISENEWHHFAFSFGSGGMKLYIDGQLMDTDAYTGGLGTSSGGSGNAETLVIGAANDFSSSGTTNDLQRFYEGQIDEFALLGSQLSDAQVLDLFQSQSPGYVIPEDTTLVFSTANGNAISVSDTLATTDTPLQVFLSVNDGTLTLSQTTGLTIPGGSNGSTFMTIQGTESDINAALEGMTFAPNADFNGSVTLNMTTSLGADLEGHYTFEGGNAIDQSVGISQDGTLVGNATTVINPERGEVLSLDGNGDYVEISGRYGDPTDVTLAAWVNLSATDSQGSMVMSLGDNISIGFYPDGRLVGWFYDGAVWQHTAYDSSLTGTGWHHVAFTFDDSADTRTLFVDGVAVNSLATSTSINYSLGANSRIGAHANGSNDWDFNGLIDDARIYTRALSADEIAAIAADEFEIADTVAITINAINDAPYFRDKTNATVEQIALTDVKSVTSADLDNDGDTDLIATTDTGSLYWYENDGTGSFGSESLIASAQNFRAVEVYDLEGDGDMDIVAMNDDPADAANSVYVLTNQFIGSGTVSFTVTSFEGSVGGESDGGQKLSVGDIDGDGRADIVGTFYRSIGDSQVVVFEQDSVGVWTKSYSDAVNNAFGVDLADMDGDGDLDIVVGDFQDKEIRWYENNGQATAGFTRQVIYAHSDLFPVEIRVSDFDRDGDQDIVYADWGSTDELVILLNDGAVNPTFTAQSIYTASSGLLYHIDVADMNGDGDDDLIVVNKNTSSTEADVIILDNDGAAGFTSRILDDTASNVEWAEAADLDGDGNLDVIAAPTSTNAIEIYKGQGDGFVVGQVNEDIALGGLHLEVSDDAGAGLLEVAINVVNGRIIIPTGSVTVLSGGSNSSAITFEGTVADVNTALNSFTFLPDTDFNGLGEIQVTVNDRGNTGSGGPYSVSETLYVEVVAVNDTPVVSGPGAAYTVNEQTNLNIHGTGFSVTDVDAASGTMTLTLVVGEGTISLSAGDSGVSIGANHSSTVSFTGTMTQINNLLTGAGTGTIIYNNGSNTPSASTSITLTVNDGGNTGSDPGLTGDGSSEQDSAVQTINITAVNDAPTIDALGGDYQLAVNDGTPIRIDPAALLDISDVDSLNFDGGSVVVTGSSFDASDQIGVSTSGTVSLSAGFANGSVVSVSGVAIGTLSGVTNNGFTLLLNSDSAITRVEALLRAVTFESTSTVFGSRSVDITLVDGDGTANGGTDSASASVAVNVASSANGVVTTNEDSTYTYVATDFDFTGVVGADLRDITIVSLPADGLLELNSVAVTVGQTITKAQIDAGQLTYTPNANENGTAQATFDFFVNSGNQSVNILTGEPSSYSLNSSYLTPTDQLLLNDANFGPAGTHSTHIQFESTSSTIDSSYLSQGQIYFGGYVSDGNLDAGELAALEAWVSAGGVLISTNDAASYDSIAEHFGLVIGGSASSTWHVADTGNTIINGEFGSVGNVGDPISASGTISYFDSASLAIGDLVIATDSASGEPTIVLRQHGDGWILFTSDEGIFRAGMTGGGVVATPNDVLAANVFAWAAKVATPDTMTMEINVTAVNDDPVVSHGGAYAISEGDSLSLDASGSADVDGDSLTYRWDLNNDATYDIVTTSATITPAWSALTSYGIDDDGVYTIGLQVDDGAGGVVTTSTTVTVANVAPTLTATGAASATGNATYTLTLTDVDLGDDTISQWIVNWGDGSIETYAGDPSSVTHVYSNDLAGLTFDITVSAIDEDGQHYEANLLAPAYVGDFVNEYDGFGGNFVGSFAPSSDGILGHANIVQMPNGNYLVSGVDSGNIAEYQPDGTLVGDFVAAADPNLSAPGGMAYGPDGDLYAADYGAGKVVRFNGTTGAYIDDFVASGLSSPLGIEFGPDGNLYVTNRGSAGVLRYDGSTGTLDATFNVASISGAEDLTFGPDGNIYVGSTSGVIRVDAVTGATSTFIANGSGGLGLAAGVDFGPDGHLYVADQSGDAIRRYDANTGAYIDDYATGINGPAYLEFTADHRVTIVDGNDAPVLTDGAAATNTEGTSTLPFSGSTVTDADGVDFDGGILTATLTAGTESSDQLYIMGVGGVSRSGGDVLVGATVVGTWSGGSLGTPLQVVFNTNANQAEVEAVYQAIGFRSTSDVPTLGVRSLEVTLTDGDGGTSNTASATVDLNQAVNDSPNFSGLDATVVFTEGGSAVVLDDNAGVGDPELAAATNFSGAILTLVRNGGVSADDVFGFVDGNGITLSGNSLLKNGQVIASFDTTSTPGELVITFTDANGETPLLSNVNSIVRQINYANTSGAPSASVQIDWTFDDGNTGAQGSGGALQATGSTTVNIIDVPNPADVVVPIAQSIDEDTPLTFSAGGGNAITVDGGSSYDPIVTLMLSVTDGSLTLAGTTGITFLDGTSNGSATLTISGTEADINTALDGLQYQGDLDFNGSDTLTVTTGSNATVEANLHARYEFLNGSLEDETANNLDGTASGNPTLTQDAQRGDVMTFDGDDRIDVANSVSTLGDEVTISAWVNLDAGQQDNVFLSIGDEIYVTLDNSNTSLSMGLTASNFTTNSLNAADNIAGEGWNHVAATVDNVAKEVRLYLNGELIRSSSFAFGDIDWSAPNSPNITIGSLSNGSNAFTGSLDDIRVYNSELTQSEIIAVMGDNGYDSASVNITVNAVNDTPFVTSPGSPYSFTEGSSLNIHGTGFSVADVDDNNGTLSATFSVGEGRILIDSGDSGVTMVSGPFNTSGNGTDTVTFTGTKAQLNALLTGASTGTIVYLSDQSTAGDTPAVSTTITLTINDQGNTGSDPGTTGDGSSEEHSASQTINITAVNDSPELLGANLITNGTFDSDLSGWSTTGSTVYVAGRATFGTSNSAGPHTLSQVIATEAGETYVLEFDYRDSHTSLNQQLQVTVDGSANLLTTEQLVTDTDGSTFMRYRYSFVADSTTATITFTDTSDDPSSQSASTNGVDGALDNISVRQSSPTGIVNFTEGGAAVLLGSNLVAFDAELSDADNFDGATLTLVRNGGANSEDVFGGSGNLMLNAGTLELSSTNIGSYTNTGGVLSITFATGTTGAQVNEVLQSITYSNSSDAPPASVQIDWTFGDGNTSNAQGTGGALTAIGSTTVNITAVNDAPVLDTSGSPTMPSITEDDLGNAGMSVADLLATGAGGDPISDVDGDPEGIAITTRNNGNGQWQYSIDGGTNWTNVGTVSESSALLLRSTDLVRFQPDAANGITQTIEFRAWDQTSGAAGTKVDSTTNGGSTAFSVDIESASITVSSINDDPTNAGTLPSDISVTEDVASNVDLSAIVLADVDHGGGNLTIKLSTSTGGQLFASDGGGVVVGGSGTASLTLTGSLADLNTFVDSAANITYLHSVADTYGDNADTIQVVFNDNGNSGAGGGLDQTIGTVNVDITAVNDAPTVSLANVIASLSENTDTSSAIKVADIVISDDNLGTNDLTLSGADAASFEIVGTELRLRAGTALDFETQTSFDVTVELDDIAVGGTPDDTVVYNLTITDFDEFDVSTPIDSDVGSNSVAESATVGTYTGLTADASDADGTTNTVTYSLDDDAGGRFTIDSVSGVVTVAGALDYETATSHSVVVRAISADGSSATQSFTIQVTDVNESGVTAISDSDGGADSVLENSANGTSVGITAFADDVDGTDTVSYSLDDNAGGRFAIDSVTGEVTVAGAIDREAAGSYDITVRATSTDTTSTTRVFTITINDVDEFDVVAVNDVDGAVNEVAENAAVGTTVGITADSVDSDATTNSITYSLDDDAGARFTIDSVSGVVTVAGALDYETATSHSVVVRATSADGSSATQSFTIQVTDVNESGVTAISDSDGGADTVLENSANGTTVGITAFADDVDGTDTVSYSLDDNAGGRFAIDSVTGEVTVAGAIDREAAGSYDITVRATSTDTTSTTRVFTITIGDVDEFDVTTVNDVDGVVNVVAENAAVGATVGVRADAVDSDATTNGITYSLVDNDGGRFAIDSGSGVVTVGGAIDREADGATRSITVRATSDDGSFFDQVFNIAINDVDEFDVTAVNDVDGAVNEVAENAAVGTTVGVTADAVDSDATTNGISYSLVDNDGGRFAIDSGSGVVTVAGAIDRESDGAARSITVRATSDDGSFFDQVFNIAINDVDEFDVTAVNDVDGVVNEVTENAAVGTTVGVTADAVDGDATTNEITYSLVDNDGGRFAIDSGSGVVTVAGAIDRESDGSARSITVRATSDDGSFFDQVFNIAINDVDEFDVTAVNDVDGAVNEVAENAAVGTTVGITADAVDSDATTNGITYSLIDNDGGRFAIDSGTGVVTVAGAIDLETDGAVRTITIRANSDDGSFFDQVFTIDILNVNEAPVITTSSSFTVDEFVDTTGGYTVSNLTASDVDAGDSLTFTIVGGLDSADFRVVGNQLQLDAGLMDFETRNQFNVIVQVSDAGGLWDQQSITVFVNDLNDRPQVSLTNVVPSIAENTDTTAGIRVADIQIQDDALGTNQLRLTGADAGHFEIVGNEIRLRAGTTLDYESRTSFDVVVEVDDNGFAAVADSADTLHLQVSDINEAPIGSTDTFSSDQFGELTLSPATLLANDSDVDGDWMSIVVVQQPAHGTLTVQANGSLLYTPPSDFEGVDQFQYVVSDGQLTSNPVDVLIDIQPLGTVVTPSTPDNSGSTDEEPSTPDTEDNSTSSDPTNPAVPGGGDSAPSSNPEAQPSVVAIPVLKSGSETSAAKSESRQQDMGTVDVLQDHEQDREEAYQRRINEHLARISRSIESSYSVSSADRSFIADAVSISPLSLVPISQVETETEETNAFELQELVVGTTAVTTTTLSVGYVIWLIRGGSLIASFASALPTWTSFDPLPIVQQANEEEDRESLIDIVRGKIRRAKR